MKLLVISSVVHYQHAGQIFAYGPYAREMEIWAEVFDQLAIAAPFRRETPPGDATPINRANVSMVPQKEVGGQTFQAKLRMVLSLPGMCVSLARSIASAEAIHVRCPGNLGLLGILLGPLLCRLRIAKYAGQWDGHPGEPLTVRMQRWILGSKYWGAPVTVYGNFPGQPPHVISYFTSIMTKEQLDRARNAVLTRAQTNTPVILYTGRLSVAKNVDILLQALAELRTRSQEFRAVIVGDGPERQKLEELTIRLGLRARVTFAGSLPHEEVMNLLCKAHALVLASETEGWPKSLTEAMAHGLVCVGSNRGLIPSMLADGRGFTVPVRDVAALSEILGRIAADYAAHQPIGVRAAEWASRYSLEGLRDSLRDLLFERWNRPGVSVPMLRSGENEAPSP